MGWQAALALAVVVVGLHLAWIVWVIRREYIGDLARRVELAEAAGLEVIGPRFWSETEGSPLVHVRRAPTGTRSSSGITGTVWAIELRAVVAGDLAAPALLVRRGSWADWKRPVHGRFRIGPRLLERSGVEWFALSTEGERPVDDDAGIDVLGLPWPAEHIETALLRDPNVLKAELVPGPLVERPPGTVLITTHHQELWDTDRLRSALLASQGAFGWLPRHPQKLAAVAAPRSTWDVPLPLGAGVGLLVGLVVVLEGEKSLSAGTILMGLAAHAGVSSIVSLGVAAVQRARQQSRTSQRAG